MSADEHEPISQAVDAIVLVHPYQQCNSSGRVQPDPVHSCRDTHSNVQLLWQTPCTVQHRLAQARETSTCLELMTEGLPVGLHNRQSLLQTGAVIMQAVLPAFQVNLSQVISRGCRVQLLQLLSQLCQLQFEGKVTEALKD